VELACASGCVVGASMPAGMVSSSAGRAYAAGRSGLILRWATGYALVLLCGLLVAWLVEGWPRAAAVATGLGAPLAVPPRCSPPRTSGSWYLAKIYWRWRITAS
jgi:hypothetical protein